MWLAQRALLAIVLMVTFYLLAAAIVLGLLWIPYADWVYLDHVHPRLAIGCIVSALALVVAVFPRRDKFDAPGPRLDEASQRKLFTMLRSVADATKQDMPAEVFLVSDVNAWVSNRGGMMGFGSRRVMGLGLPLLQGLTVSEFTAVIAHEFGHYAAGDVGLGPWIDKTRAAIARVMSSLGDTWVSGIFNAYGKLFMRLTLAISRQQEFLADALAARIVHPRSWPRRCAGLADCLRRLPRTGKAKCRRPLKPGICRRSRPASISSSGRNPSRRR
jgi:Zn-dependent protease with chaperone function